jgi:hypothetical protein
MPMPRRNRQLLTVQLDLFRPSSPRSFDWTSLSADVREKVMRLIGQMLSKHQVCNLPCRTDGGHNDE